MCTKDLNYSAALEARHAVGVVLNLAHWKGIQGLFLQKHKYICFYQSEHDRAKQGVFGWDSLKGFWVVTRMMVLTHGIPCILS